ncbi:MAG: transporter [Nitrosomonadaceae bacterium]|nr:transporter [Nitrosomonadaceae bacterium]
MRILPGIKSVSHLCMIGVLLLGGMSVSWAQKTDSSSPEQVVKRLHESLAEAMREGSRLGFKGRLELLTPIVTRTHELDFIARTTLGNLWSKLSPDQQVTFTDTFRQLSISSYADWFKSHEGEAFEFVDQQSMPREQVLVRSLIVKGKDEVARLDYVLRETKDGWRIINIMANGVSDLALKRVEYRSILERDGFPALIDMLKKKIATAEKS